MLSTAMKDAALRTMFAGPLKLQITDLAGRDLGLPAQAIVFGQPEGEETREIANTETIRFAAWSIVPPLELAWRLSDAQGNERASGSFESNRAYEPGDELFIPAGMVRVGVA